MNQETDLPFAEEITESPIRLKVIGDFEIEVYNFQVKCFGRDFNKEEWPCYIEMENGRLVYLESNLQYLKQYFPTKPLMYRGNYPQDYHLSELDTAQPPCWREGNMLAYKHNSGVNYIPVNCIKQYGRLSPFSTNLTYLEFYNGHTIKLHVEIVHLANSLKGVNRKDINVA